MSYANPDIIVGSRVSAKIHYLRETASASAVLGDNTNAPSTSFKGNVMRMYMNNGVNYCPVATASYCYRGKYPDLLNDAVQATSSTTEGGKESDAETVDLNWEECSIRIDQRFADLNTSYQYVNPALVGLSGAFATPNQFFLHFLPRDHINPFHNNVNFTDLMEMSRFNDISGLHVFVVPDGELYGKHKPSIPTSILPQGFQ
ncbi:hypothetical protein MAM1_1044d11431 [Mucor ambiguus]|uniref:Uncharacterized protein n=1 Tax=Mucor ambiguus TaxID=91626 RepID=A0A0C9N6Y5_9FUNG|nr:hypothetical protein MAM1_1044d11431 [Mucor ambiguus]